MATPLKAPEPRPIPRYPPIEFRERIRPRGPPSWAIWTGAVAAVAYGFSQVGRANVEGRYWKNKKREQKMAIAPLLQAEEDLAWCEKYRAALEEEAAIMKHVPDWKVGESVYKTKVTWIPPIVWPYSKK